MLSRSIPLPFADSDDDREIKTPFLKVRDRTLVFADTIFPIANLSVIEVIDLSTMKSIPRYIWVIGGVGALMLLARDIWVLIGIALIGLAGYLYYQFTQTRITERYGLRLVTNSGISSVIVSGDRTFLQKVALTLYNIVNGDAIKAVTFNFDQRQIVDVETLANSSFVMGNVSGDLVNNV